MEDGSLVTPMALAILSILLEAGRGVNAETCRLDDVFSPDDLSSGSESQCELIYLYRVMDLS